MYYCNPINIPYRYQYVKKDDRAVIYREAADPSLVVFHGKYYMFPSMTKGYLVSEDMVNWQVKKLQGLPVYDYAPDVRVMGEYLYFSASRRDANCDFYRTKDPESGVFEKIEGTFDFWDPNLFVDDDGCVYFYWGCSSVEPIYGVELDPKTMKQIGQPMALFDNHKNDYGYERVGEDHNEQKRSDMAFEQMLIQGLSAQFGKNPSEVADVYELIELLPEERRLFMERLLGPTPNMEGAWMTKYQGKYYLQYAAAGTEYNIYPDGVYEADHPLGPFTLAKNNPYSYSPGGFMPGAGHGSTMQDLKNNWWHTATMRISCNHEFERRLGLWPAGFDRDGELFCNQRYGDWPILLDENKEQDPWREPDWMLLSYGKQVKASSQKEAGKSAANVVDENCQTWWKALDEDSQPWIMVDLGKAMDIHAIQLNFMDDHKEVDMPQERMEKENPEELTERIKGSRYIEDELDPINYLLEGSEDGKNWETLADKEQVTTSLPHDFLVWEQGIMYRFIRVTVVSQPHEPSACMAGIRIFGLGDGQAPAPVTDVTAERISGTDMNLAWKGSAVGYEILWGHEKDKLYHSYRVFGDKEKTIRALVSQMSQYYVRIDAFNENGITHGKCLPVKNKM